MTYIAAFEVYRAAYENPIERHSKHAAAAGGAAAVNSILRPLSR